MSSSSCLPSPRWHKLARIAALCLALAAGDASATAWRAELPQAVQVGAGDMRWLGLPIYHAALWSEDATFDPSGRFALQLTYHRSIGRERLVRASMDEMRRLGASQGDPAILARWEMQLRSAFIDVQPGDQLIGVHLPGHGMRLYDKHQLVADIADPALARAFFGIWLHAGSRDQALRRQLLGRQP